MTQKKSRSKRRPRRDRQEPPLLDPETALAIVDDDLPDGAYWAMLEEMTGLEPADFIPFMDD